MSPPVTRPEQPARHLQNKTLRLLHRKCSIGCSRVTFHHALSAHPRGHANILRSAHSKPQVTTQHSCVHSVRRCLHHLTIRAASILPNRRPTPPAQGGRSRAERNKFPLCSSTGLGGADDKSSIPRQLFQLDSAKKPRTRSYRIRPLVLPPADRRSAHVWDVGNTSCSGLYGRFHR